ncbi:MAG: Uma2 family endonuclease [Lachnospiraceae bacterium]|nr:Uma2 family endonuclease [Lachnospiraceae bacterium]
MTIDEMRNIKREFGYTNEDLAKMSGVPLGTVQKVFSGVTKYPRKETLRALENSLAGIKSGNDYQGPAGNMILKEEPAQYGISAQEKTSYTLEDYLALPEEERVELIDGQFYDMAAPTSVHQAIGGYIHSVLLSHVLEKKGPCMPMISPVDVQLDCDDKTVVQPDVMIICDRSKFQNGRVFGAPEFLVEVLSPSTRKKDMQLKLYKYANAGVKEYWMVDPVKKYVVVYDMENLDLPKLYSFEEQVPVGIWDGECRIDLAEMYAHISFLYS